MKVISSQQMSEIESLAYRNGASNAEFMEEAGSGVALVVHEYVERRNLDHQVILLCGKGNNAGDAYVAGIQLLQLEYEVTALQAASISEFSPLCKQNFERFMTAGGRLGDPPFILPANGIIVDGIFGTGFHGKPVGPYAELIHLATQSKLPIISVDIPSGLNGETGEVQGESITASETAFLGLPKMGFFLCEGWNRVGQLRYVDFGLPKEYIEGCQTELIMLSDDMLKPTLPVIKRSRHKYEAGYVIGLAGSPGMPGAAILSSTAALRGGAGIVKLFHPDGMQAELAICPSELIRKPYHYESDVENLIIQMNRATATFIGPGINRTPEVRSMLRKILPRLEKPCVIDADALTILSEEEEYSLPAQTIMTPHMGEMMRLLKINPPNPPITLEFLKTCKEFAVNRQVTLVLKGAPTFILDPAYSSIFINPTGDPGMATAGSGDVLTGFIASLLAQKLSKKDAATLGVYLHGLAGEFAADDLTSYCLNASDIIYRFPEAFKSLEGV